MIALRVRIGQTKVKRYWPGKAPEWADGPDENEDMRMTRTVALEKAFPNNDDADIAKRDDPRLRRLAESKIDDLEEIRADHRRIRQAETISTIEEDNRRQEGLDLDEEDEDASEERRKRYREKTLQRQQEEAALLPEEEALLPEEEEESDEEEEEESDEEQPGIAMVKLVFVPKSARDTIAERERLEAEDRASKDSTKRLEERKIETKQILVEEIRKNEQIQKNTELEADIADDDLYEAWKVREIARIKRNRDDREAMLKEKEEIDRVRNMTDQERKEWERKNPKPAAPSKQKWRFMQKYYHRGAFYQTYSDNLVYCNFSAPTGEDKMDKTILPKVMQVKNFGRKGRTKWTHLVNEDTTDRNNPRWTFNDPLGAKYNAKMAGMDVGFTKPKGSKRIRVW